MVSSALGKTCFVISPIGQPGSDVREHADDLFDYVIKPALEQAGYQPMRADHMTRPGLITEQMYEAILKSDLLVAVITFRNPNVFYELAIAQAAARPIIILNLKGETLPFDIKDIRILDYDLKPRALMDGAHARNLLAAIRSLEAHDVAPGVVFNRQLSPLGALSQERIYYNSSDELTWDHISAKIERAQSRLWLMGISQRYWLMLPPFLELMRRRCGQSEFDFRILIMHEDNPALPMMLRDADSQVDIVRAEIASTRKLCGQLSRDLPGLQLKQIVRGCVMGALNISDVGAIYTPYLISTSSRHSPSIVCTAEHPSYGKLQREFQYLWDSN